MQIHLIGIRESPDHRSVKLSLYEFTLWGRDLVSVVRIIEVYVFKYMRILSEHWKLSVIERCPYQEVRLYYEPLYHALQIWQL